MQTNWGLSAQKIVLSEINSLIIALRTNSRFSPKARFQCEITRNTENPIFLALKDLRDIAQTTKGWQSLNILDVLKPFFQVIRSEDTTGPITGIALQSIEKFLRHPCIHPNSPSAKLVIEEIVSAVKECQFEVTDAVADEAVLIKILQVFCACVSCETGCLLDEKQILEIVKSCFRVGRETRPTEILRRSAEISLQEITEIIFKRVLRRETSDDMKSFFEFICNLCDPEKEGKSASLRLLGLTLANTVLEILGPDIVKFPGLLNIAQDNLARAFLRNSITSNVVVLSQTLRGMHNLIACAAPFIHEQIASFILDTHLRIADSKTSSFEHQELILESLCELCSDEQFVIHLFEHFDCHEESLNIFERLCKFLSKNSFPVKEGEPLNIRHILSLKCLLNIVRCICERTEKSQNDKEEKYIDQLLEKKKLKKKYITGAELFNQSPKKGIAYLHEQGLLKKDDPTQIAQFLKRYNNWLSKSAISECLKKSEEIVEAYMKTFDFSGLTMDDAIRFLVHYFHLKGEGQQIERITRHFAYKYFEDNKDIGLFENGDAAWVYAFAVIMLNSDLHNPQNRNKMTLEEWMRNTRNTPNSISNEPIPDEELERIYNSVLKKEFQLETTFKDFFKQDPLWNHFLKMSKEYYENHKTSVSDVTKLDCEMFRQMWGNAISAISVVFETTEDSDVLDMCTRGFMDCAKIAAHYRLSDVFDNLVISLCKFTDVLSPQHENSVTLFGQNEKSQVACKTVFNITRNYGDNLREGWKNILDLIIRLFELELLPQELLKRDSFAETSKHFASKKRNTSNIGSALYLFGFFNTSSDDDLLTQHALEKTKACIAGCRIEDLLNDAKLLHADSLEYLVKALIFRSSIRDSEALTAMLCLDILTDVVISNKDRISLIWNYVNDHFHNLLTYIMSQNEVENIVLERVVINVISLNVRLLYREDVRNNLLETISLLGKIQPSIMSNILPQLMPALLELIKSNAKNIKDKRAWNVIVELAKLGLTNKKSYPTAIDVISTIVVEGEFIWPDNIPTLVNTLMVMGTVNVVDLMLSLQTRMISYAPSLTNPTPMWTKSFICLLEGFCKLCTSSNKEIRNKALITLQRILLDKPLVQLPPPILEICINKVLFALMGTLLTAEKTNIDPTNLDETRLRSANLLAKTFLQYLPFIQKENSFHQLWCNIIGYMKRYMSIGSELLAEAIPELIKNMVLVMDAQQTLKQIEIWNSTRNQLHNIVPSLIQEMINKYDKKEETKEEEKNDSESPKQDETGDVQPVQP